MLEKLLSLPGFVYQIGADYYYLGKWICKKCEDVNASDCVVMYQMCVNSGEEKEASMYFQKIRAYSDFALEIPYNAAQIKTDMETLLESLDETALQHLETQVARMEAGLA